MDNEDTRALPSSAQAFIAQVIRKVRYRKKVRANVRAELEGHFEDALAECEGPEERNALAQTLIQAFGDAKTLAVLIRRAKKRCRPLWVKVMIHTAQVAGLCVLYTILCMSRLYIGRPTIKVDTIAMINATLKQGRDESLNALPDMQAAADLLTDQPDDLWKYPAYADMNDVQRQVVDAYLHDNRAALDRLTSAVTKPFYWRQFDPAAIEPGDTAAGIIMGNQAVKTVALAQSLADQSMSGLPKYRELARALTYRAKRYCCTGETDQALKDAVTTLRFGHLVSGHGLLVEQLVGIAVTALGQDTVLTVVQETDPNAALLEKTYADLQGLFDWNDPWIDHSIEKAMVDDMIQRGFTDDGLGNGRPLTGSPMLMAGSPTAWIKGLLLFDYPDRQEVRTSIERLFGEMYEDQVTPPWACRDLQDSEATRPLTIYEGMIRPALARTGELQWRCKIGMQAMLTVLAIKHYQAVHGVLPQTLNHVVTNGLLDTLPRDFYGHGPLTYVRTSDTDFMLYSWGENLKDDQGNRSTTANGKVRQFASQGDWVFWPVMN